MSRYMIYFTWLVINDGFLNQRAGEAEEFNIHMAGEIVVKFTQREDDDGGNLFRYLLVSEISYLRSYGQN